MYPELTRAEWDLKYFKARSAKAKVDACLERIYTSDAELKAKDTRIAELEAKLEPKSCYGCKYEEDKRGGNCYAFSSCSRDSFDHYTPKERG